MTPESLKAISEIVTAAASSAVAIENGVAMLGKKPPEKLPQPSALAVPAGISGAEFLAGMMLVAFALLGAAVIIRSGLVA